MQTFRTFTNLNSQKELQVAQIPNWKYFWHTFKNPVDLSVVKANDNYVIDINVDIHLDYSFNQQEY